MVVRGKAYALGAGRQRAAEVGPLWEEMYRVGGDGLEAGGYVLAACPRRRGGHEGGERKRERQRDTERDRETER